MGYPLYREVKKWAPATLTHREKLAALILADDANDVTRETYSSVVDPDILRFAMIKNERDMRKVLTRLLEEKVLERVTVGGNGRTAKYRFLYLAPATQTTAAGPERTANNGPRSGVAGPERTSNSGVAGTNETANPHVQATLDVPEKTCNSGVAGSFWNSCRSESDRPTPSTSSTTSSTTSAAAAAETDSADGTLFDASAAAQPKPQPAASRSGQPQEPEAFDGFWQAYPRRVGRKAAVRAWDKALKDGVPPQRIVSAAEAYARERHGQPTQYTKHPATWLNGGHYDDEPAASEPGQARHQTYRDPADHDLYDEDMI